MNMLYDSDTFAVVHIQTDVPPEAGRAATAVTMPRHGFEIVDKRSGKEIYLDGSWAERFQQQIQLWQTHTPTQEEVEDTLEGYTQLAQTRVQMH